MSMSISVEGVGSMIPGAGSDAVPYRLAVFPFPPGHFRVHAFRARERLSKPYAFDIGVTTAALVGEDLERLALGQRAAFVMTLDGVTRVVPGIIARVRSEGVRPAYDVAQYTLRLVPSLWRLGRRKSSRIFQNMSVDQVVDTVLRDAKIATRWHLSRKYPVRQYCTQYEETDLEFVERLLAEAGILYYFVPPQTGVEGLLQSVIGSVGSTALGDALAFAEAAAGMLLPEETVAFTDDPSCTSPLLSGGVVGALEAIAQAAGAAPGVSVGPLSLSMPSPTLHYLGEHGFAVGRSDKVTALVAERRVHSNVAEFREFDPDRPGAALVFREGDKRKGAAGLALGAVEGALAETNVTLDVDFETGPAISATVGAAAMGALAGLLERNDLETYEHHGRFLFPDWQDCADEPDRVRRERKRRAVLASGESLCSMFSPGHRFHLADHPVAPFNREWALVGVRHAGNVAKDAELYRNSFECVPANVLYPPKRKPRATVQSTLTATVAGPTGEEIYVDSAGRIKVRFHWDRRGAADEHASCWIRVMQPWSGTGWGTQFIPRVGMEVVVVFEGGDPDRPLVTGCVYNGTHPPAFPVPDDKTRSGIRTQSSPNAQGFNELSFEDAAGKEQIYVHAQRDLDEIVLHDHTLGVGANERITVGGMRQEEIVEDLYELVRGEKDVKVRGNHTTVVEGTLLETVDKNADYLVHGIRQARIDGQDRLAVGGAAERLFEADLVTRVEGNRTIIVGKNEAKRSYTLRVEGATTISSEDSLVLECPGGITFACGTTVLRLGPRGMEMLGGSVRATGKGAVLELDEHGLTAQSKGAVAQFGSEGLVVQTSASASLSMKDEVKIQGKKILLNSPDRATDKQPANPKLKTEVELVDHDGKPLAAQRFTIKLEDGSERTGVTDKDGKAALALTEDGEIRFAELQRVEPGPKLSANTGSGDDAYVPYVVRQGDHLQKIAFRFATDPDTIWNDPRNESVKAERGAGDMLLPTDILYVQTREPRGSKLSAGTKNRYRAQIPTVHFHLAVQAGSRSLAGEDFEIEGGAGGEPLRGTAGPDGAVDIDLPVSLREFRIHFPRSAVIVPVRLGDLDPISERSGVIQRLRNLGFVSTQGALDDADLAQAVAAFERAHHLTITGRLDSDTRNAIRTIHGS